MSSDAFRDALAQALEFWGDDGAGGEMLPDDDGADAILAMPEMQAIRSFMLDVTFDCVRNGDDSVWNNADGTRVQQSVIDWVLGGPS